MDHLIRDIESFCAAHSMIETQFGIQCLSDPAFVLRLRRGRDCRYSTIQRVQSFMDSHGKGKA